MAHCWCRRTSPAWVMEDHQNKWLTVLKRQLKTWLTKKTNIMVFNTSKKYAFPADLTIGSSEKLQVKPVLKILGIQIQEDLKWGAQVDQMVKKASNKIWMLRRMKNLGVDETTIANYWKTEGRIHLEAAAAVWTSGLTARQSRDLQRVEHRAVAAFTSRREEPTLTCRRLGLQPLAERRQKLAKTFAIRTTKKSRHQDMFVRLDNPRPARGERTREWREEPCRTSRHHQSALPYLTRLLNGETK